MNRWCAILPLMGFCLMPVACAIPETPSGLVISNVTLISPERTAPLEPAYVRILDGQIAEVSERPLRGEFALDGTGRYLIPGLIDSHVHLAVSPGFPSGMTAEQAAAQPEVVASALVQDPRSYLFFGFTTVVDLVGSAERNAQWNALDVRPDAYFCGAAVSVDGQLRFGRYPSFSYDASPDERIPPVYDPAGHTPDAVVASIKEEGAICVKTFYEQGVTMTVEDGRSLVGAAHERGLPVFIHANRKEAQAFAVATGMDVIVHGMWRNQGEEVALDDEASEVLMAIVRDQIGYQPTTQVIVGLYDMLDEDYFARPELADAYPPPLVEWYRAESARSSGARTGSAASEAVVQLRGTLTRASDVTRILAEQDGHLLFGSDTPSSTIHTNPPGLNGRLEMDNWIAAGVSEEKLFRALTIDNARALGLDDEIATIEPGKSAHLLLLRANPLESVDAYDTIERVILNGQVISRELLSARNTPVN